jgi:hypothetical protein
VCACVPLPASAEEHSDLPAPVAAGPPLTFQHAALAVLDTCGRRRAGRVTRMQTVAHMPWWRCEIPMLADAPGARLAGEHGRPTDAGDRGAPCAGDDIVGGGLCPAFAGDRDSESGGSGAEG